MNTKIKLITIILMTLAVVGGGVLYFSSQLRGGEAKDDTVLVVDKLMLMQSDSETIVPELNAEQLAVYKPSANKRSKGSVADLHSSGQFTEVEVPVSRSASLANQQGAASYGTYKTERDDAIHSSGGASLNGNGLLAYSRSNRGSEAASIASTGSAMGTTGNLLFAPSLGGGNNDWVLIDPEPTVLEEGDENQIVPVGNGVYALALLSMLYGFVIYFRRRG